MATQNTMREALVAELLGDLDALIKRIETLNEALPGTLDAAEARIRQAGEASASAIEQAGVASSRELERQGKGMMQGVENATHQTQTAARAFQGAGRTLWAMAAAAILGGGVAGAVVAVVVVKLGLGG